MRTTTSGHGQVDRTEPAAPAGRRTPPVTAAALVRQVGAVIADVPWFLAAPLLRHWHRTWGATEEEAAYAARVYLELIHGTLNKRVITDAELTLSEERREEIRHEVSEGL